MPRDLHNLKQTVEKEANGGKAETELLREWVDGFVQTAGNTVNSLIDEDDTLQCVFISYMTNLDQLSEVDFREALNDYNKYVGQLVNSSKTVESLITPIPIPISVDPADTSPQEVDEPLPPNFNIVPATARVGRKRKTGSMFAHKRIESSQAVPPSAQLAIINEAEGEAEEPPPAKRGRPTKKYLEARAAALLVVVANAETGTTVAQTQSKSQKTKKNSSFLIIKFKSIRILFLVRKFLCYLM